MSSIAPTKLRDKPNEFGIDVVFLAISLLRHKQPKDINNSIKKEEEKAKENVKG